MNKKILSIALSTSLVLGSFGAVGTSFANSKEFSDIENSFAKEAIQELFEKGILQGDGSGQFNPQGQLTRAQFVVMMVKSMGLEVDTTKDQSSQFKDVPAWAAAYVDAAFEAGLIKGTGEGMFSPNAPLTREQSAVIMVNALIATGVIPEGEVAELTFKDADSISDWAKDAVALAFKYGLIKGNTDGTFNPQGTATREQAAQMSSNFIETSEELAPSSTPEPTATPSPTPSPSPTPTPGNIYIPDTTAPTVTGAELKMLDAGGLIVTFSVNEQLNLKSGATNVELKYFTKNEDETLVPIRNTKTAGNLVKDKSWAGYLASTTTSGLNYSSGSTNNQAYSDTIPANSEIGSIVNQGFHGIGGDMDYVEIDWNEAATYVVQIIVTDASNNSSTTTVQLPVPGPTIHSPKLDMLSEGGLIVTFQLDEALDLQEEKANVELKYYEKVDGVNVAIQNTMAGNAPLVKNKDWAGYLASTTTPGLNYSSGVNPDANEYEDLIPANSEIGSIVKRGYHPDSNDMDYVAEINWSLPATYVVEIIVTDANGIWTKKSVEYTVPTAIINPSLNMLPEGGLIVTFSLNGVLDLSSYAANVELSYFTKDSEGLHPIRNTMEGTDLVKNKSWAGYLASITTPGLNYSSGVNPGNTNYSNLIPANAEIGSIVRQGYHQPESDDMDYVNIIWSEPATYVVEIKVTDASGQTSIDSVEYTVYPQ